MKKNQKTIEEKKTLYRTAVDIESAKHEYVETTIPIKYNKKEKTIMEAKGVKYILPNDILELE